jgi:hypothetical protein
MKHPTHRPLGFALKISWHCREWQEVFWKQHVKFMHVKHWHSRTSKGFHVSTIHLILLNTDRPHKFTKCNHSIRVQVKEIKNLACKENWAITISVDKLPNQAAIETKLWLTKSNHRTQNHVQNRTQQTQYALMIRNHGSTTHLGLSTPANRQSEMMVTECLLCFVNVCPSHLPSFGTRSEMKCQGIFHVRILDHTCPILWW